MFGDTILDTFHEVGSSFFGMIYMFFFGFLFIIIIVKVVLAEMEVCFFEAVPGLCEEEQYKPVDHYTEGWKNIEEEERPRPFIGFDFLGGSPSNRSIQKTVQGSMSERSNFKSVKKHRVTVSKSEIIRFFMKRIKEIRHSS